MNTIISKFGLTDIEQQIVLKLNYPYVSHSPSRYKALRHFYKVYWKLLLEITADFLKFIVVLTYHNTLSRVEYTPHKIYF